MKPTEINDGGPAFPHIKFSEKGKVEICPQGVMSLRDYFAAQALAGLLSSGERTKGWEEFIAYDSYLIADAMLERKPDAGV
jgi:hypothetical protein